MFKVVSRVRLWVRCIVCFSLILFLTGIVNGSAHYEAIGEYPITEDSSNSLVSFLDYHQWEELLPSTPMNGLIDSFAAKDSGLCAIQLDDTVFLIRGSECVACYHYHTEGEYRLLFHGDFLVIYDVRDDKLLFVAPATGSLSLYTIHMDKADLRAQAEFFRFGMTQQDARIDGNGYYVTNYIPQTNGILNAHSKLIWTMDGQETIVYSSPQRIIWLSISGVACIIAVLIFFSVLYSRKRA